MSRPCSLLGRSVPPGLKGSAQVGNSEQPAVHPSKHGEGDGADRHGSSSAWSAAQAPPPSTRRTIPRVSFSASVKGTPSDRWDPAVYRDNAEYVIERGRMLLSWLELKPGERILDLGCGEGALSEIMTKMGCHVLAIDSSPAMVDATRSRGIEAQVVDATRLTYHGEFDAVVANFSLHWMKSDPEGVLRGVRRAHRPTGRYAGAIGGIGNAAAVHLALRHVLAEHGVDPTPADPWYFPSLGDYRARVESAGFHIDRIDRVTVPITHRLGLDGWLDTFGGWFSAALPEDQRTLARRQVIGLLEPILCDRYGNWEVDHVALRFLAHPTGPNEPLPFHSAPRMDGAPR